MKASRFSGKHLLGGYHLLQLGFEELDSQPPTTLLSDGSTWLAICDQITTSLLYHIFFVCQSGEMARQEQQASLYAKTTLLQIKSIDKLPLHMI
jgi:hypothetical protein